MPCVRSPGKPPYLWEVLKGGREGALIVQRDALCAVHPSLPQRAHRVLRCRESRKGGGGEGGQRRRRVDGCPAQCGERSARTRKLLRGHAVGVGDLLDLGNGAVLHEDHVARLHAAHGQQRVQRGAKQDGSVVRKHGNRERLACRHKLPQPIRGWRAPVRGSFGRRAAGRSRGGGRGPVTARAQGFRQRGRMLRPGCVPALGSRLRRRMLLLWLLLLVLLWLLLLVLLLVLL